jgi:hypothetical protein
MAFWDRFVLWLYASMAESLPVGRNALGRVLALAFLRGRLAPASLNDLSLLLILATSPGGAPLRTPAEREVAQRRLVRQARRVGQLLQAIRPPQVADLLEIGRPQPLLRGLVGEALVASEFFANLCTFLGRLFLRDPAGERSQAVRFLVQAAALYYRIPQGTVDFTCRLYHHVLRNLRPGHEVLPSMIPSGPQPGWFTALDVDEQQFLDRCLTRLPEPDLVRLYLQFYARLTVAQITHVQQQADRRWTPDQVALRLEQCWQTVL